MLHRLRLGFALLFACSLGVAGAAEATSIDLGHISAPGSFGFSNTKNLGAFTDQVHFTIDPGATLLVRAKATNSTWRHGGIYDMDGTLSDGSGVILDADAELVNPPFPYPDRIVTWQNIILGPGDYFLSIFGTSESEVGVPNFYSGAISFAQTPLPTSLLLMLTALGGFGLLGWRRSQARAAKRLSP